MSPLARRALGLVALVVVVAAVGGFALAPGEEAICDHVLGLAVAGGEDLEAAGVDDASCRAAMERRRAKMNAFRRARYGICVVMADTLDEIGRC